MEFEFISRYLEVNGHDVANVITASIPPHDNSPGETRTKRLPIAIKDSFVLSDWHTFEVVQQSDKAPKNGFLFDVKDTLDSGASCIVYMDSYAFLGVDNRAKKVPFYMSALRCLGGSSSRLVPLDKVCIFFCQNCPLGSGKAIFDGTKTYARDIDLTATTQQAVELLDANYWVPVDWELQYLEAP
ncbi:hypothetical protein H0H92_009189 [Tricholoma furcatifolium]|nr:hypothetical protein H0H92_009189 [Tricholoma furcatifolium]